MWYEAFWFAREADSRAGYQTIEVFMRPRPGKDPLGNFSTFHFVGDGGFYVVTIGTRPEAEVYRFCMEALQKGKHVRLPDELYQMCKAAREKGKPKGGEPHWKERHDIRAVGTDGEEVPMQEVSDYVQAFLARLPFIQRYEMVSALQDGRAPTDIGRLLLPQAGAKDIIEAINHINGRKLLWADKYIFTDSALALHKAVSDGKDTWIQPKKHTWIEFERPLSLLFLPKNIMAFYLNDASGADEIRALFPPHHPLMPILKETSERHAHHWTLNVIDEQGMEMFDFTYDTQQQTWVYLASHRCPWGQCRYQQERISDLGTCYPCLECQNALSLFRPWIHTALCILRRDYAITPDPQDYPTETQYGDIVVAKTVGSGKKKRTVQTHVTKDVVYKVVSFDVSQAPSVHETVSPESSRGNWLSLYGKEVCIYRRMEFSDVVRHYRAPHYQRLIDFCLQQPGYTFSDEVRTYQLYQESDGTYTVVGAVRNHSRYVPMLPPTLKKSKPVIKKALVKKKQ